MHISKRGFGLAFVIVVLVLFVFAGGAYWYVQNDYQPIVASPAPNLHSTGSSDTHDVYNYSLAIGSNNILDIRHYPDEKNLHVDFLTLSGDPSMDSYVIDFGNEATGSIQAQCKSGIEAPLYCGNGGMVEYTYTKPGTYKVILFKNSVEIDRATLHLTQ